MQRHVIILDKPGTADICYQYERERTKGNHEKQEAILKKVDGNTVDKRWERMLSMNGPCCTTNTTTTVVTVIMRAMKTNRQVPGRRPVHDHGFIPEKKATGWG